MITAESVVRSLPPNARVLDVGCFGYQLLQRCLDSGRADIANYGVDYSRGEDIPDGFVFETVDLNREPLPFPCGHFDFVLASHVIEHLRDGVAFFAECARVTKPGGLLLITCPSERSVMRKGFPFAYENYCSSSFFDDPTHLGRPYSPQSLFRIAEYHSMELLGCGYDQSLVIKLLYPFLYAIAWALRDAVLLESVIWKANGWVSYALARKPATTTAEIPFRYFIPPRRSRVLSWWSAATRKNR